jgi:lincosamide nucleotidyltransferase B/F
VASPSSFSAGADHPRLLQDELDRAFRSAFEADERVRAAIAYGSRPAGLGDAFSDVEFWAFVDDAALEKWSAPRWIRRVAEPLLLVENEFGAWVAIYAGLVRLELHLWPASDVEVVRTWAARGAPVAEMVVVDRDGRLGPLLDALPATAPVPMTAEPVAELCGRFANWWVLGRNVLSRGELERAQDALSHVRRILLWMARVHEGATDRWLTPSRLAEQDLSRETLAVLAETYARTDSAALATAYATAWGLGEQLWRSLSDAFGFALPPLLDEMHDVT